MRIAIISDIHGNLPALEAVLADIKSTAVDAILCLGDIANVGPHPAECLDIVQEISQWVIQGNHELYLLGQGVAEDWRTCPTWSPVRWAQSRLRPPHFDYIRDLPYQHQFDDTLFVHGSPLSQFLGFMSDHTHEMIAQRMNGLDNLTVFTGHTHVPLFRRWQNSWLANVGSVGMPLDGSPLAKYAIATQQKQSWHIEFRMVAYDIPHLMQEFERLGLQKEGGVVTAVLRWQMLTGRPMANTYLHGLRLHAEEAGVSVGEIYGRHPIPPEVQHWFN